MMKVNHRMGRKEGRIKKYGGEDELGTLSSLEEATKS